MFQQLWLFNPLSGFWVLFLFQWCRYVLRTMTIYIVWGLFHTHFCLWLWFSRFNGFNGVCVFFLRSTTVHVVWWFFSIHISVLFSFFQDIRIFSSSERFFTSAVYSLLMFQELWMFLYGLSCWPQSVNCARTMSTVRVLENVKTETWMKI